MPSLTSSIVFRRPPTPAMNSASLRMPDIAVRALKPRSASHGSLEMPAPEAVLAALQPVLA